MGRFKIRLLLSDNTWSTKQLMPNNHRCTDSSTDWTPVSLGFTKVNYCIELVYDKKGTVWLTCNLVLLR